MHVLTVHAHPNPKSFCHAVLEQFNEGLREAGHTNEVLDLYAIGLTHVKALFLQTTITRGVRPREERDRLQHRGAGTDLKGVLTRVKQHWP